MLNSQRIVNNGANVEGFSLFHPIHHVFRNTAWKLSCSDDKTGHMCAEMTTFSLFAFLSGRINTPG